MTKKEQICFDHHIHDESCFLDRAELRRKNLERNRSQCEIGWPMYSGWGGSKETAPKQHAPIKLDASWRFCPFCGRVI